MTPYTCGYICSQLMIASYIEIFYFRSKSLQVIAMCNEMFLEVVDKSFHSITANFSINEILYYTQCSTK